ncbi:MULTISPECIES: integrase core domain-containing protein [unclassified Gilliamella]|uniref:integrase core domain-containing protein n=1 Tax=unclassified Gilliamella TaxID=2685620 RepID=UPI00082775FF|nr:MULTISPECIES: integrase core domain-containing protein [Gilliamella]NUF49621.1 transposase [Gilliamella sp. ESL0250]OCG70331.1 hypothetical protein A9G41_00365 [Gilliamella apicola]
MGILERFNRIYRTEVLDLYLFNNLEQARKVTEEWLTSYNNEKPHEALNNMTQIEYKTLNKEYYFLLESCTKFGVFTFVPLTSKNERYKTLFYGIKHLVKVEKSIEDKLRR